MTPLAIITDFGVSQHAQGTDATTFVILSLLSELYVDDGNPNPYQSAFAMLAERGLAENHAVKALRARYNQKTEV